MVTEITFPLFLTCFAASFLSPAVIAADKPDFSGSYTLARTRGALRLEKGKIWTLEVSQTESAIEVTRVMDGHRYSNNFPLNGSEGVYVSPGGQTGTCKAQVKGKDLVLDTLVTMPAEPGGSAHQVHRRERWELSSDLKTLTIRVDVDFPHSPVNGYRLVQPWTEIYTRN